MKLGGTLTGGSLRQPDETRWLDTVSMDDFVALDLDPHFRNFNFCALWDPTLTPSCGPSESALYKLAYLARQGERGAIGEFGNTLDWTLREESFECFQRIHGPRPIRFAHWFYAKLDQLLSILLHDEILVCGLGPQGSAGKATTDRPWEEGSGILTGEIPAIQPDELERAFSPEDSTRYEWFRLVNALLSAGDERLITFQKILEDKIEQRASSGEDPAEESVRPIRRRQSPNEERDAIIASCLKRGEHRLDICRILDKKGITTTPQMRNHSLERWTDAWADPQFRNNVQQVFSKVKDRCKLVNP
jgi:hypothetical protein